MKFNLPSLYNSYRKAIRNPKYRTWIILGTLIYVLSPFDLSPDFFPIAGQIDDFFLVSIMLTEVSGMMISSLKEKKEKEKEKTSGQTIDVEVVSTE